MHQMEIEAEAFKCEKFKNKSILRGVVSEKDQMIEYYESKIKQYRLEVELLMSQRNVLAEIVTD